MKLEEARRVVEGWGWPAATLRAEPVPRLSAEEVRRFIINTVGKSSGYRLVDNIGRAEARINKAAASPTEKKALRSLLAREAGIEEARMKLREAREVVGEAMKKFDASLFSQQEEIVPTPRRDIWERDLPIPLYRWSMLDASNLLKPTGLRAMSSDEQGRRAIFHMRTERLWFFDSGAANKTKAEKAGRTAQRNLIARRNIDASTPLLHDLTLYVGWEGGAVKLEPLEKKSRGSKKPTQRGLKNELKIKIRDAIGGILRRDVVVKGSAARGFEIPLSFKDKRFGVQTMRLRKLEDGDQALSDLVGKLKSYGAL